jgi:hypothetical protein
MLVDAIILTKNDARIEILDAAPIGECSAPVENACLT